RRLSAPLFSCPTVFLLEVFDAAKQSDPNRFDERPENDKEKRENRRHSDRLHYQRDGDDEEGQNIRFHHRPKRGAKEVLVGNDPYEDRRKQQSRNNANSRSSPLPLIGDITAESNTPCFLSDRV